jgi:ketopantoate reductase
MGRIDEPLSPREWDVLTGQSTPEGEAIVGEIVRLAEERGGQTPGQR